LNLKRIHASCTLRRDIELHLRRVFAAKDPYVLSTCPSTCPTGSALSHSRDRPINMFYLQRYNTKHKAFVNVDSVEEINEGDKVSVAKLDYEDGVDQLGSYQFNVSGNQRPGTGSDVPNSKVSLYIRIYM